MRKAIVLAVIVAAIAFSASSIAATDPPPLKELLARDFTVTSMEGKSVPLSSLIATGRPTVIEFWATWCSPCLKTMPALVSLDRKYSKSGLQIVGLTVEDPKDDVIAVKALTSKNNVGYQIAFASEETFMYASARDYVAVPKTIVYDASGNVIAFFPTYSFLTKGKIERAVEKAMDAYAPPSK